MLLSLGHQWRPIQVVGTPACGRQNPATCSLCRLYRHEVEEPVLDALTATREKTEAPKAVSAATPGTKTGLSVQKHGHPEDHLGTDPQVSLSSAGADPS